MQSSISVQGAARMARGALERIEDGRGACIQVWDGALWITQEGDPRDYLVPAGESFRIARNGVTLVNALCRSVVTVCVPQESAGADKLGERLARLWADAFVRDSNPTTAAL